MSPEEEFTFVEAGGRPRIEKSKPVRFFPNDEVYFVDPATGTQYGPYTVASSDRGMYRLSDSRGHSIQSGRLFEEKDLRLYNPF